MTLLLVPWLAYLTVGTCTALAGLAVHDLIVDRWAAWWTTWLGWRAKR